MYLFTRPDGTYLVEKPECCRRVLPETENINRGKTFSKYRTSTASQIAWDKFQRRKVSEAKPQIEETDETLFDRTEKMMDDVDAFLEHISATSNINEPS